MSLNRLMYYSAVIGGWAAFLGWLLSEFLIRSSSGMSDRVQVGVSCALVGAAIGAGLNLVAGMVNAGLKQQSKRVAIGLALGGVGGYLGGYVGQFLFDTVGLPRVFGWTVMGAAIGIVEGLYDRSPAKVKNGLIGGAVGGFVGGFLFDPIVAVIASESGMSSRATAFVILGMCIGLLIGLVRMVLKDAWLTVLDGFRPGRQLILAEGGAVLGRAEYATLPFSGKSDQDLDLVHARVLRQPDGTYTVEDNQSHQGTSVNRVRIGRRTVLKDGDVITIGYNSIKFNEKARRAAGAVTGAAAVTGVGVTTPPVPTPRAPGSPPPPPRPPMPPLPPAAAPRPAYTPPVPPPAATPVSKPASAPAAARPSPGPYVPPARPAAAAAYKPPVSPPVAAPAAAAPKSPPSADPEGVVRCPRCKAKVAKGQRFCVVCQDSF